MGIAWSAQNLFGGRFGARGFDGAVLTGARGMFGGVGEAVGVGAELACEPAACRRTQVSLMSERRVLAVGEVEPSER